MTNYNHIEIFFSDQDQGWIARLKNHTGISAFGKTSDNAYEELKIVIEECKEIKETPIVNPKTHHEAKVLGFTINMHADSKSAGTKDADFNIYIPIEDKETLKKLAGTVLEYSKNA